MEKDKEEEEASPNTPDFLCLCSLVNTILEIYMRKYIYKSCFGFCLVFLKLFKNAFKIFFLPILA